MEPLLEGLRAAGLEPVTAEGVPAEPKLADLQRVMDVCAAAGADLVIAIGGGEFPLPVVGLMSRSQSNTWTSSPSIMTCSFSPEIWPSTAWK